MAALGAVPVSAAVLLPAAVQVVQHHRGQHLPCTAAWRDPDGGDAGGPIPADLEDPWSRSGPVRHCSCDFRRLVDVHRAGLLHRECADANHRDRPFALPACPGTSIMAALRDRRSCHRICRDLQAYRRLCAASCPALLACTTPRSQGTPGPARCGHNRYRGLFGGYGHAIRRARPRLVHRPDHNPSTAGTSAAAERRHTDLARRPAASPGSAVPSFSSPACWSRSQRSLR